MVAGLPAPDEMRRVPRRALCSPCLPFFTSHLTLTWLFQPANSSRLPFVIWDILANPEAFLGSTPQISLARPLLLGCSDPAQLVFCCISLHLWPILDGPLGTLLGPLLHRYIYSVASPPTLVAL